MESSNISYLFAVFAVTWGGFFAYVLFVARRQAHLRRDLDSLQAVLNTREEEFSKRPDARRTKKH